MVHRRLLRVYEGRSTTELRRDLREWQAFRDAVASLPGDGASLMDLADAVETLARARAIDADGWLDGMEARYHPGGAPAPLHVCVDRADVWGALQRGAGASVLIPALRSRGLRFLLHRIVGWGSELGWGDVRVVHFPDTPPVDGVDWFWRRLLVALDLDEHTRRPGPAALAELRSLTEGGQPLGLVHCTVEADWSWLEELADYHAELAAALATEGLAARVCVIQGFRELAAGEEPFPTRPDAFRGPGAARLASLPEVPEADFVAFLDANAARIGPALRRPVLESLKAARQTDDRYLRLADGLGEPLNGDVK